METKIKYHQNGIGQEYGPDHKLTNNWDPDKDYGDVYSSVHFRINSKEYMTPTLGFDPSERERFYKEVQSVLQPLDWYMPDTNKWHDTGYVYNGKARLYLHPQDFSGVVKKNDIKKIAETLSQGETFSLEWVDLYESVYDMSDKDYLEYVKSRRGDIENHVFEIAKTKRRTYFYTISDVCTAVYRKIRLPRVADKNDLPTGPIREYVVSVIRGMVTDGWLVGAEVNNVFHIRSINKSEQKKLHMIRL